jgi:hypothetical protein
MRKREIQWWLAPHLICLAVLFGLLLCTACSDDVAETTTVASTNTTVMVTVTVEGWITAIHRVGGKLVLEVQAVDEVYLVEVRNTTGDVAQSVTTLRYALRVGSGVRFPGDLWPSDPEKNSCAGEQPVMCRLNADALQVLPPQRG